MTPTRLRPPRRARAATAACLAACLAAGGCLSAARVKEEIRSGAVKGALVEGVPFVRQRRNTCGPAALASAMLHAGIETSEEEIARELSTGERGGTVTFDLALHARDRGLLAVQRYDAPPQELMKAVRAGVPPVVMLGGILSILGRYHYAIVTGFDESRRIWLLHYGVRPDVMIAFDRLEKLRRHADAWVLCVCSSEARPEGLPPEVHLEMGLAAEKLGSADSARHHYAGAAWTPQAAQAMLNLSNVELSAERLERSEVLLRRALERRPDFAPAKNNLAWVLLKRGEGLDEAERLAREAAGDERVRADALDTLAAILDAAGRKPEAAEVRREISALKAAAPSR